MRKFQLLCFLFLLIAGVGIGRAQDEEMLSCTVHWATPGTVVVYDGGFADKYKVSLSEDQTSYTATAEGFGYLYVAAAPGYALVDAACDDDDTLLMPVTSSNAPKITFDLTNCNGKSYTVNVEKIEYDGEITVNFVSGGKVTATFGGTAREFELQGGSHAVPYSTRHEPTIEFSAKVNGSEDPYLKHNGETVNWAKKYNFSDLLTHDAITLATGDNFKVKYNSSAPEDPSAIVYHTVTMDYADAAARQALQMIFNQTQFKSVSERDSFTVRDGDVIKFTFDTKNYSVTINGEALTPNEDPTATTTTWITTPLTADLTVSLSVTEREYGTTTVKLSVTDVEGLVARRGALDGEVIDLTSLTPYTVTFLGTEYNCYDVEVSEKSPKVFVEAAPGWWLRESVTGTSAADIIDTRMAGVTQPLYVKTHKICRDKQIAVNVQLGAAGEMSNFSLKNAQRETFALNEGANLLLIDEIYDSPLTVQPINIRLEDDMETGAQKDDFSVYNDYTPVAVDDESLTFKNINVNEGSVVYLFVKRKPATTCTVRVIRSDDASASQVKYDVVKSLEAATHYQYGYDDSFSIFYGGEIEVTPVAGQTLKIDGDEVEVDAVSGSWTLTAAGDHLIVIGDTEPGEADVPQTYRVTPANEAVVTEIEKITLAFPYAESVALGAGYDWSDAFFAVKGKKKNYCDVSGEVIADAEVPTVVFTLAAPVTEENEYNFWLDEDFLVVNGDINFGGIDAYYTVRAHSAEEMVTSPANGSTVESFDSLRIEFPYAESTEIMLPYDELSFRSTDNNTYANYGWTVEDVSGEYPAYTFTPNYRVSALVDYVAFIPEGFFKVNGSITNEDTEIRFSLRKELDTDEIEYEFSPVTDAIVNSNNAPIHINILFDEDYQVQRPEGSEGIEVKLGDDTLVYGEEWEMSFEKCYFGVKVLKAALESHQGDAEVYTGTLTVSVARGAFKVSGADCPQMSKTWNIVEPKEYGEIEATSTLDEGVVDLEAKVEFVLVFAGADTATLERKAGLCLQEDNYDSGRYYEIAEEVVEIAPAGDARYASASGPAFRVTFPALQRDLTDKVLKFTSDYGTFLLDGLEPSAAVEKYYSGLVSGIVSIGEETGNVTVVTPAGVVLLRNAPAAALKTLPRGIYIINGKAEVK